MGIGVLGPLTVEGSSAAINRRDRVVLAALAACRGQALSAARARRARSGVTTRPCPGTRTSRAASCGCGELLGSRGHRDRSRGLPAHDRCTSSGRRALRAAASSGPGSCWSLGEADRARVPPGRGARPVARGPAARTWSTGTGGGSRRNGWRALRLDAEELRLDAALRAGEHAGVLTDLTALVRAQPLRERRWALLALAAVPVRPPGRGAPDPPRGAQRAGAGARSGSRPGAGRPRAGDPAPGPGLRRGAAAALGQRHLSVPGAARLPGGRRRRVLRSGATMCGLPATGCGRRASWPSSARRAAASRPWCGPASPRRCERDGAAVVVVTPGAHPWTTLAAACGSGPTRCWWSTSARRRSHSCREPDRQVAFLDGLLERAATARWCCVCVRTGSVRCRRTPSSPGWPSGACTCSAGWARGPARRDRGPGPAGRAAPGAGPGGPAGPRARGSARCPADDVARVARVTGSVGRAARSRSPATRPPAASARPSPDRPRRSTSRSTPTSGRWSAT